VILEGLGISSFGGVLERPKGVQQYFDLFFGDYAIREAHPTTNDRISNLEDGSSGAVHGKQGVRFS